MASAEHRSDLDVDRFPFHVNSVCEPLNDVSTLFGKHFGENRVASIHRDFHQIVVEIFDRVFDAVALLDPGIGCIEVAAGINRVAEGSEHFFEHNHFCTEVGGFNGSREPRAAGSDDDDVVFLNVLIRGFRSFCSFGGF